MTHDELLAKIDERNLSFSHPDSVFSFNDWPNKALRAVVELHKPQEITLPNGDWGSNCAYCDIGFEYPCPTIEAIEKALG